MATWVHVLNPFSLLKQRILLKYPIDYRIFKKTCRVQRLGEIRYKHVYRAHCFERTDATSMNEFLTDPQTITMLPDLRRALNNDCRAWIFHADKEQYARLTKILGKNVIRHIERFGGRLSQLSTSPYAIRPVDIARALFQQWEVLTDRNKQLVHQHLNGIDTRYIGNKLTKQLESHEITYTKRSWFYRLVSNPRFIAYLIVFIYSTLRVLPVALVKEFKGNLGLLWTIDVVTAIPYTWGVLEMVTARTKFRRFMGMIVTLITFVAPYIYFWMTGEDYPTYVIIIVLVLILSAVLLEAFKYLQEKTLVSRLEKPRWQMPI